MIISRFKLMLTTFFDDATIIISLRKERSQGNSMVAIIGGLNKEGAIRVMAETLEQLSISIKNDIDHKNIMSEVDSKTAEDVLKQLLQKSLGDKN